MADAATIYTWLSRAQTVATVAATLLAASILRAFQTGQWSTSMENRIAVLEKDLEQRIPEDIRSLEAQLTAIQHEVRQEMDKRLPEDLMFRLKQVENRMERAGMESSRLATEVQGLPERLRKEFALKERFDEHVKDYKEDRQAVWNSIDRRGRGTR